MAIALVTGTSGAVLVLEVLATRVLAPYVGVNLETFTAIIGTILAGIALGAWAGGVAADRIDPRGLIPVLLVGGGALAMASIPIVRALGGDPGPDGDPGAPSVLLALWGFGPSAAVLSAVPPAVVKLQLRDLDRTGSVVGRLSAWSTAGAIGATGAATCTTSGGVTGSTFCTCSTVGRSTGGLSTFGLSTGVHAARAAARPTPAAAGATRRRSRDSGTTGAGAGSAFLNTISPCASRPYDTQSFWPG